MSDGNDVLLEIKAQATNFIEHLAVLCANIHLNVQRDQASSPEEKSELHQEFRTLKGLAQIASLAELAELLGAVEQFLTKFIDVERNFTSADIEILSDIEDLCARQFEALPDTQVETLATELQTISMRFSAHIETEIMTEITTEVEPELEASSAINPELNGYAPTQDECARFAKYLTRVEKYYLLLFEKDSFAGRDELLASEYANNINSIGDIVIARALPEGALLLFTAELDVSILEQIFGTPPFELQKTPTCLEVCQHPWNLFVFDETNRESLEPQEQPPTDPVNAKPVTTESQLPTPPVATEDFDSKNLDPNAVFEKPDLDPEMLQDFLSNSEELLEALGTSILELENDPTNAESITSIFRSAHTIKGTAGMFGLRAIEKLTHGMENLFDRVRKGQLLVTPAIVDAILFGLDRVKSMFSAVTKGNSAELPINDALSRLSNSSDPNAAPPPEKDNVKETLAPKANEQSKAIEKPNGKVEEKKEEAVASTIRVDLKRLDSLVNLVGELVIDRTRFARIEEELRARTGNNELGHLMSESVLLFSRHMNEVQSVIMKIRMVPIGNAFHKFTRVVRDLSRQCGKEIDLDIFGGETELDKTLVEEIGDPLVHLIRNSVDHGIEAPNDRERIGKSPRGKISLSAAQDGNMIVITVQDDGKGLQVERLRNKALQQGLIKESDLLSDKEIFNLIFEAGFSTADKVTNISGRGVGMDVVKKHILKLKGVIELDSRIGHGTTTTIKLPLTLAIIPSLMFETHSESYAIPLVNVIESIRITPDEIQRIGTADFVKLRDRVLPLLHMSDIFNLEAMEERTWYKANAVEAKRHSDTPESQTQQTTSTLGAVNRKRRGKPRLIFVVVGVGEKRVGIIVDQLLGQQEIVIKPLGKILEKPHGVAGSCVLGNGRVALVVDVGEIVENFRPQKYGVA